MWNEPMTRVVEDPLHELEEESQDDRVGHEGELWDMHLEDPSHGLEEESQDDRVGHEGELWDMHLEDPSHGLEEESQDDRVGHEGELWDKHVPARASTRVRAKRIQQAMQRLLLHVHGGEVKLLGGLHSSNQYSLSLKPSLDDPGFDLILLLLDLAADFIMPQESSGNDQNNGGTDYNMMIWDMQQQFECMNVMVDLIYDRLERRDKRIEQLLDGYDDASGSSSCKLKWGSSTKKEEKIVLKPIKEKPTNKFQPNGKENGHIASQFLNSNGRNSSGQYSLFLKPSLDDPEFDLILLLLGFAAGSSRFASKWIPIGSRSANIPLMFTVWFKRSNPKLKRRGALKS
ncbi:hypothetical protein CRG98_018217 [Punica granatum]|uniref:Uncharacterized protein n=1 Tax=Punica granatum TaxID=22663 RepID=A0A2I0JYF9_PUNGR|nr:hypothetical protein CRG98_018217 [Punica granatum]